MAATIAPVQEQSRPEINGLPVLWSPHPGPQSKFLSSSAFEVGFGGAAGGGKGLALDTPLVTPTGWTTMGKVAVGDTLYDEKGQPCRVTYVAPVENRACFRITFDDGSTILSDDVHRWMVLNPRALDVQMRHTEEWRAERREKRERRGNGSRPDLAIRNAAIAEARRASLPVAGPWTGAMMMDTTALSQWNDKRSLAIPVSAPLDFQEKSFALDPYVLGAWLGDGTTSGSGLTCHEQWPWVVEEIRRRGYEVKKWKSLNAWSLVGLTRTLRFIGVLGNKHIPPEYLRGSIRQRRALMAGLMDTDGFVAADGQSVYTSTLPRLAADVQELAHSLGYKTTLKAAIKRCQTGATCTAYNIFWTASDTPVTDPRKAGRLKSRTSPVVRRRYIVEVAPVDSVPTRCISVDSASRLFIAGQSMIPTHNTAALVFGALRGTEHPLYRHIIFRRTFPELQELMDRAALTFPKLGAHWNDREKRWTFPSGGKIEFGYCSSYAEVLQYQTDEFTRVSYDQLDQVPEERIWTYLSSRVRAKAPDLQIGMRATFNPGGAGGHWIKRRFVDVCPKDGSPIPITVRTPDGKMVSQTRAFIRAFIADNPALLRNDPTYAERLGMLSELEYRQLALGDWDAMGGAFYPELTLPEDQERLFISPQQLPALTDWHEYWGSYDWGFSHPACFASFVRIKDTVYWLDTLYMHRYQDEEQASMVSGSADKRCLRMVYAGHDAFARRMAHSAAAETVADVFQRYRIHLEKANIDREAGAKVMRRFFAKPKPGPMPKGTVTLRIVDTPGNRRAMSEFVALMPEETKPNVPAKRDADEKGQHGDDGSDCARYGLATPSFETQEPAKVWTHTNIATGRDTDWEESRENFRMTDDGVIDRRDYAHVNVEDQGL